jgi:hypothetical protein
VRLEAELAKIQAMVEAWRNRVKAHVLICMLACYLAWHLRTAWAPLTCTDEHPPPAGQPVAPGPSIQQPSVAGRALPNLQS